MLNRRNALLLGGSMIGTAALGRIARAQSDQVDFALIAPLSGPWARGGQTMRQGAETAVADINAQGGIAALGGAKVNLVVADAGDTPDKARNAAQRLVSDYPNLAGGAGCWLSSFTLAVTEVTERAGVPWLANGFADQVTQRGFKYVFQTIVTSSQMAGVIKTASLTMAREAGADPKKVGLLVENTPAAQAISTALAGGGFAEEGVEVVVNETFMPPLSDATSLVQRVRAARPDYLLLLSTSVQDNKLVIDKLKEFGMGPARLPIIVMGAQSAAPELLQLVGKDNIEGVLGTFSNWPKPSHADLVERMKAAYGEAWIGQDQISTYGDMWLLKEAVERAGSAEGEKVAEELRAMDITDGVADYYSGNHIKFDETGRLADAGMVIVQWQDGLPVLVYPKREGTPQPIWSKG